MANSEQLGALIDDAEKLLLERYNVSELDGDLAEAVAGLRSGGTPASLARFAALLADRPMFRWRAPADENLAALRAEMGSEPLTVEEEVSETEEDLSRLTVAELTDRLTARGIEIPVGAKKADLVELLEEGAVE